MRNFRKSIHSHQGNLPNCSVWCHKRWCRMVAGLASSWSRCIVEHCVGSDAIAIDISSRRKRWGSNEAFGQSRIKWVTSLSGTRVPVLVKKCQRMQLHRRAIKYKRLMLECITHWLSYVYLWENVSHYRGANWFVFALNDSYVYKEFSSVWPLRLYRRLCQNLR